MYPIKFNIPAFSLDLNYIPWDTEIIGSDAIQLENFVIRDPIEALIKLKEIVYNFSKEGVGLATCRLPHESIKESMILESVGFKFIEMVLHPFLDLLSLEKCSVDKTIKINEVGSSDLEELSQIAEVAFEDDRFTIDPRIPCGLAGKRYKNWVLSCDNHPTQRAQKFSQEDKTLGFFIIEEDDQLKKAYWHLTAISPEFQGLGFGTRCWQSMLEAHRQRGMKEVSTTISARNSSVLNLYSKLNFRFKPPQSTFHWVNPEVLKQDSSICS